MSHSTAARRNTSRRKRHVTKAMINSHGGGSGEFVDRPAQSQMGYGAADLRLGVNGHWQEVARSGLLCTGRCSPGPGGTRGFVTDEHRRSTKLSIRDG